MPEPYDWPTLREWLIRYLDLFLTAYANDGPWDDYRATLKSRHLDRARFKSAAQTAREAVLYITDVVNEPCHEEEVRYLTQCQEILLRTDEPGDALQQLSQAYEDVLN